MYSPAYYPPDIISVWGEIDRAVTDSVKCCDWITIFKIPEINTHSNNLIELAGKRFDESDLSKVWRKSEIYHGMDVEVHNAAHRFHWPLVQLSKGINAEKLSSIYKKVAEWNQCHQAPNSDTPWQPYNISERICNWIVLWQAGQRILRPDAEFVAMLSAAILKHLFVLANRLEYPASDLINNHILNNGRALYIGGQFLNRTEFSELGKAIIQKHTFEMFDKTGFLREGSSHYQLLLTRTYMEMYLVAKESRDDLFSEWLGQVIQRIQSAALHLAPMKLYKMADYPRIGDISPDIPFDWYDPGVENTETGWNAIWRAKESIPVHEINTLVGWLKLETYDWCVITFSHPDYNCYPIGHGHNDFGSFQLYKKGMPILIDIGRLSYMATHEADLNGFDACAHNCVLLNRQSVLVAGHGCKSLLSGETRRRAHCEIDDENSFLTWKSAANNGRIWQRDVIARDNESVIIKDEFCMDMPVRVDGFLYLSNKYKIHRSGSYSFELIGEQNTFEIIFDSVDEVDIDDAPYYPQYGVCEKIKRLHWLVNTKKRNTVSSITIRQHGLH